MTKIETICTLVCEEFGVSMDELMGRRRFQHLADARAVALHLSHEAVIANREKAPSHTVARFFGVCRTNTTHAKKKVQDMQEIYPAFRNKVQTLKKQIKEQQ